MTDQQNIERTHQRVELGSVEVLEALCRMLDPYIKKKVLLDENRYGVDILRSKTTPGLYMLHFITPDRLEVNLEFDLMELQKQGKTYLDSRMELICMQLPAARKERHDDNAINIREAMEQTPATKKPEKPLGSAVRDAMHGRGPSFIKNEVSDNA